MLNVSTVDLFEEDLHTLSIRAANRYIREHRAGTVKPDETQAFLGEFWEIMYSRYRVVLDASDESTFEHYFKRECRKNGIAVDFS